MSSPALVGLGAAAGWFSVFVCAQLLALRAGWSGSRSLVIPWLACAFAMLATIAVTLASHGTPALLLGASWGLLTMACLFVLYVPALYTVLTSLSVQTMILLAARGGSLPQAELNSRFASRNLFQDRLATLVQSGYISGIAGNYRLTSRGRRIAKPFAALKELWRLGPGG